MLNTNMESENQYETSSSKTVILWRNDKSPDEFNITNDIDRKFNRINVYKVPRRLSDNYLYLIKKTANDLINRTITDSEWITQCILTSNKPDISMSSYENKNKATCVNHIQQCKDRLFTVSNSHHSLLSDSGWLTENGMFDDHAAIMKISDYIKHNWNLDASYLFTIDKMDTSNTCNPTCHRYKVEFSAPTKKCVIPQITVNAFFTIEFTYLLSLPTYVKYQLDMDMRGYVVGKDPFNKKRFLHLFKLKRDAYIDINKYSGWSSEPCGKRF